MGACRLVSCVSMTCDERPRGRLLCHTPALVLHLPHIHACMNPATLLSNIHLRSSTLCLWPFVALCQDGAANSVVIVRWKVRCPKSPACDSIVIMACFDAPSVHSPCRREPEQRGERGGGLRRPHRAHARHALLLPGRGRLGRRQRDGRRRRLRHGCPCRQGAPPITCVGLLQGPPACA